jgi:signal transduction histidine kinase
VLARRILRSSTFRLVLLYMALVSGSVLLLFGFIYWATAGFMDRQVDVTIEAEIQGLAEQYRQRGLGGLKTVIAERVAKDPIGSSVYLLVDADLQPIVGNLSRWPAAPVSEDGWIDFTLRERGSDGSEEHRARGRAFLLVGSLRLLVGRDIRDLEATRSLIVGALGWGLAISVGLALAGGLTMTSSMVRRIEAINDTSREIVEGDLTRRIPASGAGDDFDKLVANLNGMLDRITGLMETVRQVSDNIAHDLRTPLTRLRSRLEIARAQQGERDPEARAAVEQAIEEADGLLSTFQALLRIARIEAEQRREGFAAVDLALLLTDVAELYEPVAAERDQTLAVQMREAASVDGDRDLLFQAVANLVDNAIKYTPAGGRIVLGLVPTGDGAEVYVADTGPGIPPDQRERVFDRFHRLEVSRSTPGSGLGLSLVRAVARLHGATIRLSDNGPGLRIALVLPWREAHAARPGRSSP